MRRVLVAIAWTLGALALVAASVALAPFVARGGPAVSAEKVYGLPEPGDAKVLYLSFDAGNAPAYTVGPLLELLRSEHVPATFFLTGKWTICHPIAARAIARDGHLLANHSYSHPHMQTLSAARQRWQAGGSRVAVWAVAGRRPTALFRPPHGDTTTSTEQNLAAFGYRTVMWTKDPSDWRLDGTVTVASIRKRVGVVGDGDVICHHVRNIETVDALRQLIPEWKAAGFEFRLLPAAALCAPEGP